MRMGNKGPHGRPWIWLMAVIVICLAPVMDPIAADIVAEERARRGGSMLMHAMESCPMRS